MPGLRPSGILSHVDVETTRHFNAILGKHIPKQCTIEGVSAIKAQEVYHLARNVENRDLGSGRQIAKKHLVLGARIVQSTSLIRVRSNPDLKTAVFQLRGIYEWRFEYKRSTDTFLSRQIDREKMWKP